MSKDDKSFYFFKFQKTDIVWRSKKIKYDAVKKNDDA
jgi:hypothetical protein